MAKALPSEIDIRGILEADTGLRIEFSKGMRAPITDGQPTLQMCWRADCYVRPDKRWVHLITLVSDTATGLFEQLAWLSTEGPVAIHAR